jgi:protein involved in temperature-dependent protein secretion
MAISEQEFEQAQARAVQTRQAGHAIAARYDRKHERVVVRLHNGVELAVPVGLVEGLAGAAPDDLADIEVTPAGLGLHWPKLDADVYVPALMQGIFGSRSWMAAQLGATGGKATSKAKAGAARANGRKGGRPPRSASA